MNQNTVESRLLPENGVRSAMSALAILERLTGVELTQLSPLQRILLITDGTLTEILEAHLLEPIELVKLSQRVFEPDVGIPSFSKPSQSLLERKINLRGARSRRIYVYAESLLVVGRLDPQFRAELMESEIPLGRLWHKFRLETYKELIGVDSRPAGALATSLDCSANASLLARTYDVVSAREPLMRISEYFCVDGPLSGEGETHSQRNQTLSLPVR